MYDVQSQIENIINYFEFKPNFDEDYVCIKSLWQLNYI